MPLIGRTVGAVVFDWDGTAVPDRGVSARAVRARLERLSGLGVHVAVVSGTHLGNIDGQLRARPPGPGRMLLGLNRGSELFEVTRDGPVLLERREETPVVTSALDRAAAAVADRLGASGLRVEIVSSRLNRRKIDLLPSPEWADPPKARIAELLAAVTERLRAAGYGSLADVAALAVDLAAASGLEDARVTSDVKHVEIGVTDKSDSGRAIAGQLARLGVAGDLVLVAGDEFGPLGGLPGSDSLLVGSLPGATVVSVGAEPAGVPDGVRHLGGGPRTFRELLDEQLRRAARLRVPAVAADPAWILEENGVDPARHRVTESLFTVVSGGVGFRGSVEESPDYGQPLVVAAGVYAGTGIDDGLLEGPDVVDVRIHPPVVEDRRVLDLRTGTLYREEVRPEGVPLRSLRFASLAEPGVLAMRVEAGPGRLASEPAALGRAWQSVDTPDAGIGALAEERSRSDRDVSAIQRLVAVTASRSGPARRRVAEESLRRARSLGFERLLCGQRAAWADRWERVGVSIPADPRAEVALRFALFQLWSLVGAGPDLAVGARGLTGSGYSGHVFWDAEVFVLPALVTIDPAAASAMVDYRLHRIGTARERARTEGRRGARFPWESGLDGRDVTPRHGLLGSEQVAILTGEREEHITADVAWAVVRCATWSRADGALRTEETELVRDAARYWASRVEVDDDGTGHLRGVIGPDEYHEQVDDNAFTNAMVRWNLRTAAARCHVDEAERAQWLDLADRVVDGYDAASGRHEQFRGYFDLDPVLARQVAEPPFAADMLLGREGTFRSQLLKQPDVLMLHHLAPEVTSAAPSAGDSRVVSAAR